MKKILIGLAVGLFLGGIWFYDFNSSPSDSFLPIVGGGETIGAPYEDGEATTTGLTVLPTAANQLATSTGWTTTGAKWVLASTASSTLVAPTYGASAMNFQVCMTATTTVPSLNFTVEQSNHATSSTQTFFYETLDTITTSSTHVPVFHSVLFASSTTNSIYSCRNIRLAVGSAFVKITFKPTINVFLWKGLYVADRVNPIN